MVEPLPGVPLTGPDALHAAGAPWRSFVGIGSAVLVSH
jgi:hypothetical protein